MHICVKCAAIRTSCCCQGRDILVTEGDVQRIRRAIGQENFWEYKIPVDPEYSDHQELDPNWLLYTVREDGSRRVLKKQVIGKCLFLGATGCKLAMDTRPIVCRLFPYDYTERGISGIVSECPTHLLDAGENLITALNMSREAGEHWWHMLYTELRTQRESRV